MFSRRDFLFRSSAGLGSLALSALLTREEARGGVLSPKAPHFEAKAKACIYLMMDGGPSHIDTFDPKPKLNQLHMTEFVRPNNKFASQMESGKRYFVQSPFKFRKAGQSGVEICEHFEHLADCVDDICFYRGAVGENTNHPTALYLMNTGNAFGGDPAMGAWVSYGLGTVNENLPAFLVLPDIGYPQGGSANWSNGFLPAHYQGTVLRPAGSPILDMEPPPGVTLEMERGNLDTLAALNRMHQRSRPEFKDLTARIESYELAFRMQAEMPEAVNIEKEREETRQLYGIGGKETDSLGRRLLMARRLVEKGVRFVQVYAGGWDSHDYIEEAHRNRMRAVDKPIAALLKDLKRTGLLESTLVIWSGEFGRSPDNGVRRASKVWGRDHNATAMAMWFAGGGVKAGHVVGATDETGEKAIEVAHPIKDVHCTALKLLGLDDAKLTYFHGGRFKQLTQVGAQVIPELMA
ncbi:MAG TPA: DUF1501 domain-containing protein [Bryobacteraceae bacterium]|jgi:hypothetical protein|nr:DUF1501 domain-containing protein [Bryobacteraceae bacterium]